ncbi:hypothetical protein ACFO5O_04590 [Geojedonia litorea]|uniref:Secreted protein n=1 Tax=Geojedonia litorea TaxID=1268269 RepID=A0ABV9N2E2_9FLAO
MSVRVARPWRDVSRTLALGTLLNTILLLGITFRQAQCDNDFGLLATFRQAQCDNDFGLLATFRQAQCDNDFGLLATFRQAQCDNEIDICQFEWHAHGGMYRGL